MSEKLNYDQLMALIQADIARAKADREADRKADRERAEAAQEKSDRAMKELREYFHESVREMKASAAETDRVVRRVSKQLGYMSYRNGAVAENYFYNSFKKSKEFGGEKFDYVYKNFRSGNQGLQDEYDIVLINGKSIALIEVKYSAETPDIAQTLKKATTFRQIFPQYEGFTFYLGLASFVFTEEVENAVLDAGLAVIKQVGKTMVVQDERVKKF